MPRGSLLPEVEVFPSLAGRLKGMGDRGERWLAGFPTVLSDLEAEWEIVVGAVLPGGYGGYTAEATTAAGEQVVLKIGLPVATGMGLFLNELRSLLAAGGQGYARLLAHDESRRALLLERLGRPIYEAGLSGEALLVVVAETLKTAWRATPDVRLESLAHKAEYLRGFITAQSDRLGHPCSEAAVEQARALIDTCVADIDPAETVLLHGDAHVGNILEDPTEPGRYKLIDPDGLVGVRAYDLGIVTRGGNDELLAGDPVALSGERCRILGELTDVDPAAIWRWGYIERLTSGLALLGVGAEADGREYLAATEALVGAEPA